MDRNEQWLKWAVELQAIAQDGLLYEKDKFDIETTDFDYFGIDELPELAEEKNNKEQIEMRFNAMQSEKWEALFD